MHDKADARATMQIHGFTSWWPPRLRQNNPTGRFSLSSSGKSLFKLRHPVSKEGALAIVTNVGTGCGGRGGVVRAMGWQGELSGLVSDPGAC